jgi:Domain of Unknown Function (DUF1080)
MQKIYPFILIFYFISNATNAQEGDPKKTEVWQPEPKLVNVSKNFAPPSDAIVLFDGKNLDQWTSTKNPGKPAEWNISGGAFTVKKGTGNIQTKQSFTDYQLHLEYRIPKNITGEGQSRGNSGLFLASTGSGDEGYEIQILDNYNNKTYVNGQVGSIYKQTIPLANASRKPGEWQTLDIVWIAPRFNEDGSLKSPARLTAFHNGVLIQHDVELRGVTVYIGAPFYKAHGACPIKLQDHGDPSEPISFRNIWLRKLE